MSDDESIAVDFFICSITLKTITYWLVDNMKPALIMPLKYNGLLIDDGLLVSTLKPLKVQNQVIKKQQHLEYQEV